MSLRKTVKGNDHEKEGDDGNGDTLTIVPDKQTQVHPEQWLTPMTAFQLEFEEEFNSSRPYRRTQRNSADISFTSSAARKTAWSIFSGLSLADISVISVFALPLYPHEISNGQRYSYKESGFVSMNTRPSSLSTLWSSHCLNIGTVQHSPFPRYGAAVNTIASQKGEIYLMGGLVDNSMVIGDLWLVKVDSTYLSCYQIATTAQRPSPRVGHASLVVGNAFIVFGGDPAVDEGDVLDDTLYLLNTG